MGTIKEVKLNKQLELPDIINTRGRIIRMYYLSGDKLCKRIELSKPMSITFNNDIKMPTMEEFTAYMDDGIEITFCDQPKLYEMLEKVGFTFENDD